MRGIVAALALCAACRAAESPDVNEIVRKAALLMNADWAADTKYAWVETDEVTKHGKTSNRSYLVVMVEGSDYRFPVAVDGQPISAERERAELAKLRAEMEKRKAEIPAVRKRRINQWKANRDESGELLLDFPVKSDFKFLREETRRGRPAYVLSASPKQGLALTNRTEKVYAGMEATVWIDKETTQPIYVECHVVKPVPIYGPLASVLPGTRIEIGMAPVGGAIWLIDLVSMQLDLAKAKVFKSQEKTVTTFSQYRPNEAALKELLSKMEKL